MDTLEKTAHQWFELLAFVLDSPRHELATHLPKADAIMVRQFMRRRGNRMALEIGRRSYNRSLGFFTDLNCDHVYFDPIAYAHAGIKIP